MQDTGVGLPHVNSAGPGHVRGYADGRHGPSKLRMSSSDHSSNMPASAALAAAGMQVRAKEGRDGNSSELGLWRRFF